MKKITFLLCLLVASAGFAQVTLEDFDGPTAPTIAFNNGPGSVAIIADPTGGGNGNVLEIITAASSAPWQQAELTFQDVFLDLSTSNKTVSVDWYSDDPFDALIRADAGTTGPATTAASHPGGGWQTLVFDFNNEAQGLGVPTGLYGQLYFFNLWDATANDFIGGGSDMGSIASTTYVDIVEGLSATPPPTCTDGVQNGTETGVDCGNVACGPCAVPPTAGAPYPPNRPVADVISFYSDNYDDVTVGSFDAGFCGFGNTVEETIVVMGVDDDNVRTYSTSNCVAWDFTNNRVDASDMTYVHFDYYTSDTELIGKVFNFKFVDFGGTAAETSAMEINTNDGTNPGVVTGQWVSVDLLIDINDPLIANSVTRSDLAQIVISSNLNNVWFDNVYFHKNTTLSTDDFSIANFKVFPNPTSDRWNVSSNAIVDSVVVYDILGKQVIALSPNANDVTIDASSLNPGMYFAEINGVNGSKTVKLIKE